MKPFLLLATRPEDDVADEEYNSFLAAGGLQPAELVRLRLEDTALPPICLSDYSGIIVGGSPYNASDPVEQKTATQLRVEAELAPLLEQVIAQDFPFLGACYGIGLLTDHLNGVVDRTFSEQAGPTQISLTADGGDDQLFGRLPQQFDAFVGHKEGCTVLPEGAVLLASGPDCPVQAFRVNQNVYATQFHPELTQPSILSRVLIYRNNGYFDPQQIDQIIAAINASSVTEPARLVAAFVERFARHD